MLLEFSITKGITLSGIVDQATIAKNNFFQKSSCVDRFVATFERNTFASFNDREVVHLELLKTTWKFVSKA